MLLVLLVTALSATVGLPADSVRAVAKPGAIRPDTTLQAPKLPVPEIVLPSDPASSPTQPAVPAASSAVTRSVASPAPSEPQQASSPSQPDAVVQQAAASANVSVAIAKAEPTPAHAVPQPTSVVAAATAVVAKDVKVVGAPESKVVVDAKSTDAKPAESKPTEAKPAAEVKPAEIKPPVVAPADAVASVAANPRTAAVSTRVDPRTVVSVRSSERFEPLYAVPIPSAGLRLGAPAAADSIVVYKRERTLVLFNRGVPIRTYFVALGSKPVGDKERIGDQRTPEGLFYVNAHNPASKFHLALRISYPDDAHRARAAALGVDPGGDIMIHGLPKEYSEAGKNHRQNDWTNGCVALSNQEIEEIWRAVPDGTPVQIKP